MLRFTEQSLVYRQCILQGRKRAVLSTMVEVLRQQGGQLYVFLRRNANYVEDNNASILDDKRKIPAI